MKLLKTLGLTSEEYVEQFLVQEENELLEKGYAAADVHALIDAAIKSSGYPDPLPRQMLIGWINQLDSGKVTIQELIARHTR